MGSFAAATVWRLRARQLQRDMASGEPVSKKEFTRLKPLTQRTLRHDRSRCLSCGYELRWYDLLPIVSWVALKGRCRRCKKSIGWFELLAEVGGLVFFAGSFLLWPYGFDTVFEMARFGLWLVAGVALLILFAYDAKWFLLPDTVNLLLAIIGLLTTLVIVLPSPDPLSQTLSAIGSVAILSGIYYLLHRLSGGRWVGFGDVKLGVGLGLLTADWRLAFVALFAGNLMGTLYVLPAMIRGKVTAKTRVPLGPLLILGTVLSVLSGPLIVDWYTLSFLL